MKLTKVYCAYFSPGDTTRKVVSGIADSFSDYPVEMINLTNYEAREKTYNMKENHLLILGVPAYAGRVPAPVVEALSRFHAVNTPVVLVVSYGNRAIDDTLMELKHCVTEQGFIPCAAASFVCQHTYLSSLAAGRPDAKDMAVIHEMGDKLRERLRLAVTWAFEPLDIPGTYPYTKPPMGQFPFVVETSEYCIYCMLCADVCPVQAISHSNPFSIENEKCLRCGACLRICPAQAKAFSEEPFKALQEKLAPLVETRQEPWYVIG